MANRSHIACRSSLGFSDIVTSSATSPASMAGQLAVRSTSVPDTVRRRRYTHQAIDVDSRNVNLVRVQFSRCRDVVFDFDDSDAGGHSHDGVEIALGQTEL